MDKSSTIKSNLLASIELKQLILENDHLIQAIESCVDEILKSYSSGGKVLFCGNGGSAADAQHLAAELSGKYYLDRDPLHAEALHVNSSFLTAVANDYSFDHTYARLVKANAQKGDVLIGLSTSGNSDNVINALIEGQKKGCITIGMTGSDGGKMNDHCKILLKIPSEDTPRIQECHMLIGHTICEIVEQKLFSK